MLRDFTVKQIFHVLITGGGFFDVLVPIPLTSITHSAWPLFFVVLTVRAPRNGRAELPPPPPFALGGPVLRPRLRGPSNESGEPASLLRCGQNFGLPSPPRPDRLLRCFCWRILS